jgi:hypothetical protein
MSALAGFAGVARRAVPKRSGVDRARLGTATGANSKGKCRKADAEEHEHGRFGHDDDLSGG